MNRAIWKFQLVLTDEQSIPVPAGWKPLSVGTQGGDIVLWASVDRDAEKRSARVQIRGTGHSLGDVGEFVGTVQQGPFVWHVFAGKAAAK